MKTRTGVLAAAAASLFVTGAVGAVAGTASAAADGKIKCEGVNSCKSHSDCKTLFSECAGHNDCAGKGFKMLSPDECDAAKAEMKRKADESNR